MHKFTLKSYTRNISENRILLWCIGPTEIWARILGFKVRSACNYTIGPVIRMSYCHNTSTDGENSHQKVLHWWWSKIQSGCHKKRLHRVSQKEITNLVSVRILQKKRFRRKNTAISDGKVQSKFELVFLDSMCKEITITPQDHWKGHFPATILPLLVQIVMSN